jgi:hypothetical protein
MKRLSSIPLVAVAMLGTSIGFTAMAPPAARAEGRATARPRIRSVAATGPETVLVEFTRPVRPISLRTDNFAIAGLAITKAVPADGR